MKSKTQTRLLALFAGAALSIASAKSVKTYQITVPDNTLVAGTHLTAGDYKVKVDGTVAHLTKGSDLTGGVVAKVDANGSIQSADKKFAQTQLEVATGSDGVNHITAIDLGGTTTKLVFPENGSQGTK